MSKEALEITSSDVEGKSQILQALCSDDAKVNQI
jgi:hypothetical protein